MLDVASQALIKRGYANLRYRDVAEEAGVPIASLQHYFPNLATLRREALMHRVLAEANVIEEVAESIQDPWIRLSYVMVESVALDPTTRREEWLVWLEFWRAAAHDAALREQTDHSQMEFRALIARTIEYGVEAGAFRAVADLADISAELLFLIDGIGLRLAIEDSQETAEYGLRIIENRLRTLLAIDPSAPSFEEVAGLGARV
ncbi:MAG: TetR/AcrR family transcriptional regulator [Gordonia sp. (in: high G+C Gram-positive bacteria)]|uniref:TetR/AcrR family transcriptional regulator n=1 Tax=Gordonia sp. (in: high G+C Gram-positive bacteria) TaxID=84139 RepID=UPI003BB749DE